MRICKSALLLAAFMLALTGISVAAPLNTGRFTTSQDSSAKQELVVTVVSVDMDHKTIQVEESPGSIMVTAGTVFDSDVQLGKLKAGTKVKVVGIPLPDGKLQASEIHAAK